jgi:hypothetical protein
MFDNIDDLFNSNKNNEEFKKLIDKMMNMGESFNFKDESDLGKPTSITTFTENGYTFQQSTWETEIGNIIKVEMINTPFETSGIKNEITLEKQLELAVAEERYEDAAKIRDEIKKNLITKESENQSIDIDEWNF